MAPRSLLVLVCLLMAHASLKGDPIPPLFEGDETLIAAQASAKAKQRPLLVYFTTEELADAERMEQDTWGDPLLRNWLANNYVTHRQVLSQEAFTAFHVPHYQVETLPTVLIYHPDGRLMGSVEGFIAPTTMLAVAQRHWTRVLPKDPPKTLPFRQPKPKARLAIQTIQPQEISLQVDGLEAYSLSAWRPASGEPHTLGLRIGAFQSYRKIRREIRRMEKIWPGDMWVYAQKQPEAQPPIYTLVLGTFDNAATANRYADALYQYATCEAKLLDLQRLVE